MNTAILTLAKDEDMFLEEWINYHFNLGFNKIFIIDNNPIDQKLLFDDDRIIIIPLNDVNLGIFYQEQGKLLDDALKIIKTYDIDYLAIIDVDEFIVLKNYTSINDFIRHEMINYNVNRCRIIWETYDDNNLIYEPIGSVIDNYTKISSKINSNIKDYYGCSKSIYKLIPELQFGNNKYAAHEPNQLLLINKIILNRDIPNHIAVINHYRFKSLETYIKHKVKLCNFALMSYFPGKGILEKYFYINEETSEKILAFKELCKKYNVRYDINEYNKYYNKYCSKL